MKKILIFAIALAAALNTFGITAFASETERSVFVTISDSTGALVLMNGKVTVSDVDSDGVVTLNDALYCAHEKYYSGGAAAGYASENSEYGLGLTKLWGTSNGGGYGYYVNNEMAMSLSDPVSNGAYINAFVYTDLEAFSDTYCYFNAHYMTADAGGEVTLTLMAAGFDVSYAPIVYPVTGAVITLNGAQTNYVTDAEGKVTIEASEAGTINISAVSDSMTLVPPCCVLTVNAALEESSENTDETQDRITEETSAQTDSAVTTDPVASEVRSSPSTADHSFIISAVMFSAILCASATVLSANKKRK